MMEHMMSTPVLHNKRSNTCQPGSKGKPDTEPCGVNSLGTHSCVAACTECGLQGPTWSMRRRPVVLSADPDGDPDALRFFVRSPSFGLGCTVADVVLTCLFDVTACLPPAAAPLWLDHFLFTPPHC